MTTRSPRAVILAAGRGSRLRHLTEQSPKSLLPIGPRSHADTTETCFLRRQVELLRECGVTEVVVVVGYRHELIRRALAQWAPWVETVHNPSELAHSGSLHSLQYASRSHGVFNGATRTLVMDADIVYHREVLVRLLDCGDFTTVLTCSRYDNSREEVLVFGTPSAPRFLGKGLHPTLVNGEPCLGEATGIVLFATRDQPLALEILDWHVGRPETPLGSDESKGFGPARKASEHEQLTDSMLRLGRARALVFSGDELPFVEVDNRDDYRRLREEVYPRILELESGA